MFQRGDVAVSITTIASLLESEPVSAGILPVDTPGAEGPISATTGSSRPAALEPLNLRVVWGDLALQPADIHVAGHYQGVLPSGSEGALDRAISLRPDRGLITEHTRRRWLVGNLGEITYFPGLDGRTMDNPVVHRVAIAGLGRFGTFSESSAEQLFASVLREITALPQVETVAMALIGTGAGNLGVSATAQALKKGFSTVMRADGANPPWPDIAMVVRDRLQAEQLSVALSSPQVPDFRVDPKVGLGVGGGVRQDSAVVFAVRAIAQALRDPVKSQDGGEPVTSLRGQLSTALPEHVRDLVIEQLSEITDDISQLEVHVGPLSAGEVTVAPTRISVSQLGDRMCWAALTARATVPERQVPIKPELVAELKKRLTAPSAEDAQGLPQMLRRWVVPEDFQHHITHMAPIVLEVNGSAAQIPWEFLTDVLFDAGEESWPLALRTPIARQLRTTYARATVEREERSGLRALVIADPGGPKHSLKGAREEGLEVARLLSDRDVSVQLFMGSPANPPVESELGRNGRPVPARVATQLDVLKELLTEDYDIIHFAGHGVLPAAGRPELAGWLFSDDVLAARELSQLTAAPRLVTANACWTAHDIGSAHGLSESEGRTELTAVLAEEFLRAGVTHFIGTSWEIPDGSAQLFAISLYDQIVPRRGAAGRSIGHALREARAVLFSKRPTDPVIASPEAFNAWAAYQHYGDPADVFDRLPRP
jgi:hypothetical protein